MKEAAIKAHRHRRLYMSEISVLRAGAESNGLLKKPQVLIDPPCRVVMMDARVASLRGLRETKIERRGRSGLHTTQNSVDEPEDSIYKRRARIRMEDRQTVEGNISHDGDYAVAVCMAFEEKSNGGGNAEPIFDHGSGDPFHEPAWGDDGFLYTKALSI